MPIPVTKGNYPWFGEDHAMFRKSVRDWATNELKPHTEEWERDRLFSRWVFEQAGKLGFLGIRVPEAYGGSELDWWYTTCWAEELSSCGMAGLTMALLVQSDMATPIIAEIGTDEQKREFLEPAVKGERIAALGISEPGVGSDVANLATTARRDGDDYVINGAKTFITNGTRSDFITLAVRTGAEAGYGSISLVLFPTDTKGFQISKKLEKIGNHCSDTAELFFEDCRIPRRYLLGQENMGFLYIMKNFQGERLVGALSATAGAQRMLDNTVDYCNDRKAFGRPLIKFQVNKHKVVDMLTRIEAARNLAYRAVDLANRKLEATREISMAKLFCGQMACDVADACLQMYGGWGYMAEYEISRFWRDTRLITIGGGTNEIMKEIIAKTMGM